MLRQCVTILLVDVPEKFLQLLHTATGNDTAVYYFGIILRPYLLGFVVFELTQLSPRDVFSLKSLNKIVFLEIFEISYCLADLLGH